jgi:1-deoxy-D-xylulose-5-phosphate synthase
MDIGFLRIMPNMVLVSPANGVELELALNFAAQSKHPVAIRYPKEEVNDGIYPEIFSQPFELGKSVTVRSGKDKIAVVTCGSVINEALKAADALKADNIDITVINARFVKPLDEKIISLLPGGNSIITVEDHYTAGGFGSAVLEAAAAAGADIAKIKVLAVSDEFVATDKRDAQIARCGIGAQGIIDAVKKITKAH